MGKLFSTLVLGLLVIVTTLFCLFLAQEGPSTAALDKDLADVQVAIADCEKETAVYGGGLLKSLIELRKETLKNTEAMLAQKRLATLRLISLDYQVKGESQSLASKADLDDILDDIQEAEKKLASVEKESEKYTGGLLGSMSLMTVETHKLTVAQLRMKFYSAKHGLPIFFPENKAEKTKPSGPPGQVTTDREAL